MATLIKAAAMTAPMTMVPPTIGQHESCVQHIMLPEVFLLCYEVQKHHLFCNHFSIILIQRLFIAQHSLFRAESGRARDAFAAMENAVLGKCNSYCIYYSRISVILTFIIVFT